MKPGKVILLFLLSVASLLNAQTPKRLAWIGITGKPADNGFVIDSVAPKSTFSVLRIKKGDILQSLNGQAISTQESLGKAAAKIRGNDEIRIKYLRNNTEETAQTQAIPKPFETSAIADIDYDWVAFKNGHLRTITRKPKGKTNVPAILLIPGYGCGSIEGYSQSYNGKLMNAWLEAGFAVVTIEKSGMGDSEGCAPCTEVDLATDIESFDAGYKYMENLPYVDKSRLYIWGHSMGGTIAPEVAKLHNPKGVMVFACVFRPWSEFLPEMHRVQKPLMEGLTYQQTETFMKGIQKIYYEFFVLKKSPAQMHENPEYKALVESELNYQEISNNMWGRHWRFWQQLDSVNLAKSWQEVKCPVLVLHGGADYEQCSALEPLMIRETVNEVHPGHAEQVTIPDLDHFMMKSKDWKEAYQHFKEREYLKGNFNEKIALETVKWLKSR